MSSSCQALTHPSTSFARSQGLRRLGALRCAASWCRQAHDLALWPSAQQLQLVDKKFGGELLASDVLGVEVGVY